jgi:hypothetical protein
MLFIPQILNTGVPIARAYASGSAGRRAARIRELLRCDSQEEVCQNGMMTLALSHVPHRFALTTRHVCRSMYAAAEPPKDMPAKKTHVYYIYITGCL